MSAGAGIGILNARARLTAEVPIPAMKHDSAGKFHRVIYVSFGLEKAGSTMTANMTRHLLETLGHPHLPLSALDRHEYKKSDGSLARHGELTNNVNDWLPSVVEAMERLIPKERIVMLRTHAGPAPPIVDLLNDGRGICHVGIRDPRDIALSLLDVVARTEKLKRTNRSEIRAGDVASTFPAIRKNIESAYAWSDTRDAIVLEYEDTAFRPAISIEAICRQLGLEVPRDALDKVVADTFANRNAKLNVGQPRRHRREMAAADQAAILAAFRDFYDRFYPGADVAVDAGAGDAST